MDMALSSGSTEASTNDLSTSQSQSFGLTQDDPSAKMERISNAEETIESIGSVNNEIDTAKKNRCRRPLSAMDRLRKKLGIDKDEKMRGFLDQPVSPRDSFKAAQNNLRHICSDPRRRFPVKNEMPSQLIPAQHQREKGKFRGAIGKTTTSKTKQRKRRSFRMPRETYDEEFNVPVEIEYFGD